MSTKINKKMEFLLNLKQIFMCFSMQILKEIKYIKITKKIKHFLF